MGDISARDSHIPLHQRTPAIYMGTLDALEGVSSPPLHIWAPRRAPLGSPHKRSCAWKTLLWATPYTRCWRRARKRRAAQAWRHTTLRPRAAARRAARATPPARTVDFSVTGDAYVAPGAAHPQRTRARSKTALLERILPRGWVAIFPSPQTARAPRPTPCPPRRRACPSPSPPPPPTAPPRQSHYGRADWSGVN